MEMPLLKQRSEASNRLKYTDASRLSYRNTWTTLVAISFGEIYRWSHLRTAENPKISPLFLWSLALTYRAGNCSS